SPPCTTADTNINTANRIWAKRQSLGRREDQHMSKIKSGGGLTSNKLVKPEVRTGSPSRAMLPERVAQIGMRTSFTKPKLDGPGFDGAKYGNELALNVGAGGPGRGRTTYHCGSQGTHGSPNPGETGVKGAADRGNRAILGERGSKV